jgi:hypothetical protein
MCWIADLFSVVDLPEEGLPTRPIRGSRGIFADFACLRSTKSHRLEADVRKGRGRRSDVKVPALNRYR